MDDFATWDVDPEFNNWEDSLEVLPGDNDSGAWPSAAVPVLNEPAMERVDARPVPMPSLSVAPLPGQETPPVTSDSGSSDTEWYGAPSPPEAHTKKNKIKKGEGRDGRPDEWDRYEYHGKLAHQMFQHLGESQPSAKLVFAVCRLLEERESKGDHRLSTRNRAAKRRMPNAYAWLDRNSLVLPLLGFAECVMRAKAQLRQ
jgi:hypothetical protein